MGRRRTWIWTAAVAAATTMMMAELGPIEAGPVLHWQQLRGEEQELTRLQTLATDRRELKKKKNKKNGGKTPKGNNNNESCTNGDLDFSFGIGGKVVTKVNVVDSIGYAMAFTSGNKVLLAGTSLGFRYQFAAAQYEEDGTLDKSFGDGGKVRIEIGSESSQALGVAVQPNDGKIVLVGTSGFGRYANVALARLNKDGSLDKSFGSGGIVVTVIKQDDDEATSVKIQPDGKIVIAGFTYSGKDYDFLIARYNSDGSLDNSFGNGGKVVSAIGSDDDRAYALELQDDGKIVVVGYSANSENNGPINAMAIARYNADGKLDSNFGANGKVRLNIGKGIKGNNFAQGVAIQPDGKIVVSGYTNADENSEYDFVTVRLNVDGSLDDSFANKGVAVTDLDGNGEHSDFVKSVTLQSDGKIVVAGYAQIDETYGFAVVRYQIDGTLDSEFGKNGIVKQSFGPFGEHAYSVGVQRDGKIVVGGYQMNDKDGDYGYFALLRVCA